MKAGFAALALVPSLVYPCLNDRDTLKFELQNVDALARITNVNRNGERTKAVKELALRAIGGRFERYPDKYYEERIKRLMSVPKLSAEEYDDLAVALDRLSKIDDAIQIIQRSKTARKSQMDWYRYHANYGTFLVHKWASQGAKKYETQLLKESISEIEEALKLFPASHFGRERIQLALQKAWLNPEKVDEIFKPIPAEDVVVGMSGIIMMGLGYELPDAYLMLNKKITDGGGLVQGVADHRFRELVNQGKPSLLATPKDLEPSTFFKDRLAEYTQLRADGERVHQARTKYFFDNLTEERHPDTDPNFWSKWKEEPYPAVGDITDAAKHKESLTQLVGLSASIVVILLASVWILLASRK